LVLGLEASYFYVAHGLELDEIHTKFKAPQSAGEALWVSLGEKGEISLEMTSVRGYLFDFISFALSKDTIKDFRSHFNKGLTLAIISARLISQKKKMRAIDYQIESVVSMIWLTRNATVDELIGFVLEKSYYGQRSYGLNEAAKTYFNKNVSSLSLDEIISLVSLLKAPSRYNPYCDNERFVLQANALLTKLQKNWPQKYGSQHYTEPRLVEIEEPECN